MEEAAQFLFALVRHSALRVVNWSVLGSGRIVLGSLRLGNDGGVRGHVGMRVEVDELGLEGAAEVLDEGQVFLDDGVVHYLHL